MSDETTPATPAAEQPPKGFVPVVDWSTEVPGACANLLQVAENKGTFYLIFAETVPVDEKVIVLENGTKVLPSRMVSSLRITHSDLPGMIKVMSDVWNSFASRLSPQVAASLPRFKMETAAAGKETTE